MIAAKQIEFRLAFSVRGFLLISTGYDVGKHVALLTFWTHRKMLWSQQETKFS